MHVPDKEGNKLQPESTSYIFLGYIDEKLAYKLYNQEAKKIITSHDVVFKEQPHAMEVE